MPQRLSLASHKVLMTLDAVGGVWRYAIDLAAGLGRTGTEVVLVGLGPQPSRRQRAEAAAVARLVWLDLPLDWMVEDEHQLQAVPGALADLAARHSVDLLHLNQPTQAAGIDAGRPVIAASHSCVATWFAAVRETGLPAEWEWQWRRNSAGLRHADLVMTPSRSHAEAVAACYGRLDGLSVVPNSGRPIIGREPKTPLVLAAGRWWDDAKNGAILDAAAARTDWPVILAGATAGPNGETFTARYATAIGNLPADDLRGRMAAAAIVASPSVYEPFGLTALEAATAGAALVLSDIPTYRELWDGAAEFVPARDASAWADAINALAGDETRRRGLGRAAQSRAQRYTADHQLAALRDAYAEAVARHGQHEAAA